MRARDWLKLSLPALAVAAAFVSAWIFEGQLTAMQEQLAVMKADQRPWVGLERFEPSSAANGQGFEFAAIVKNTGKTAATNVHGSFAAGFFGNDMLAAVPKDCGNKCSVGLLLPDGTLKWPLAISTSDVQKTIANTEGAFYVLGRIDYEDADNKYWTTVCWYYDRVLSALAAWSGCNDEGSQKKKTHTEKTRILPLANIVVAGLAALLWFASAFVRIPDLPQTAMSGQGSITDIMQRQSKLSALAAFCTAISVAITAYLTLAH